MVLVWTPPQPLQPQPPHAKACVSRNCDTNAHIKFIFDTSIDDLLEWKNPIDFGEYREKKWPPAAILWKYDEQTRALHNLIKNAPITSYLM